MRTFQAFLLTAVMAAHTVLGADRFKGYAPYPTSLTDSLTSQAIPLADLNLPPPAFSYMQPAIRYNTNGGLPSPDNSPSTQPARTLPPRHNAMKPQRVIRNNPSTPSTASSHGPSTPRVDISRGPSTTSPPMSGALQPTAQSNALSFTSAKIPGVTADTQAGKKPMYFPRRSELSVDDLKFYEEGYAEGQKIRNNECANFTRAGRFDCCDNVCGERYLTPGRKVLRDASYYKLNGCNDGCG